MSSDFEAGLFNTVNHIASLESICTEFQMAAEQLVDSGRADDLSETLVKLVEKSKTLNEDSERLSEQYMSLLNIHGQLQTYSQKLEQQASVLTASLENTTKLKEQQDADYYLMSLLMRPMSEAHYRSTSFHVDCKLKQFKTLERDNGHAQLGGDVLYAGKIKLNGKDYVVILNGDSMGKSSQGASGALVTGSVFRHILNKTQKNETNATTPEWWIHDTMIEIHRVFAAFEGALFSTALLMLIDECTGCLYYANADHPAPCLFRDGVASFLDNRFHLHMLGTPGFENQVGIEIFQMKQHDIIFLGSDGKDDVIMKNTDHIDPDSHHFLELANTHNGDLDNMFQSLVENTTLTDDFSLVRIQMTGNVCQRMRKEALTKVKIARQKNAERRFDEALELLLQVKDTYLPLGIVQKELARAKMGLGDYKGAADHSKSYNQVCPYDTDGIYFTSYCLYRAGIIDAAIDYAEKVRLRQPVSKKILAYLVKLHQQRGNFTARQKLMGSLQQL